MLAQSGEVSESSRKFGVYPRMQNRLASYFLKFGGSGFFVEEQTHLSNEADVRQSNVVSHKEFAVGQ